MKTHAQKRLGIPPAAERTPPTPANTHSHSRTPLTPANPANTREHPLTHHPGEVYTSVKKPEGLLGEDSEYVKIENKRSGWVLVMLTIIISDA